MSIITILTIIAIVALVTLLRPKSAYWVYKILIFLGCIIVLLLSLYFTLRSPLDVVNLNVDLHPWKNYILPRWGGIFLVSAVAFLLSQIPFHLVQKKYIKKEIMAYTLLIVVMATLAVVEGVKFYCPNELQACNEVVKMIDDYNSNHKERCVKLQQLGFKHIQDYWYEYKNNHYAICDYDSAYNLEFRGNYNGEDDFYYTYNSEKDIWEETIIW